MARAGSDLEGLLGEAAFIALAEAFGGTRLFVPVKLDDDHEIAKAIGSEPARRLSARHAPDYLVVPLAREVRARHYRAVLGLSNAKIARRLGITEKGVERMFQRMTAAPRKGDSQLPLFPDA